MVIPCLSLRDKIAEKIKSDVENLKSRGIFPSFAIIQIGDNPASNTYIRVKTKKAEELGIKTEIFKFQTDKPITEKPDADNRQLRTDNRELSQKEEVETLIEKLNHDPSIHGIIIQRPIPKPFDQFEKHFQSLITPAKDIDGLSENSPFINPLVQAVNHVIRHVLSNRSNYRLLTTDYRLVIVGKGKSAGTPIYNYFLSHRNIQLRTTDYVLRTRQIDSHTPNPTQILKSADIIISCVGKERIINAENIKKGVILISVGQHQSADWRTNPKSQIPISNQIQNSNFQIQNPTSNIQLPTSTKWAGDYNEEEIKDIASFYTRTPGGIGPLNVIFLLKNVIQAI